MKIASIELRNIQIVRGDSDQTIFAADLYVNGERAGSARNEGRGPRIRVADHATMSALELYADAVLPRSYTASGLGPVEYLVEDLVLKHQRAAQDAKFKKIEDDYRAGFEALGMPAYVHVVLGTEYGQQTLHWIGLAGYDSSRPFDPYHAMAAVNSVTRKKGAPPLLTWIVRRTTTGEVLYEAPAPRATGDAAARN